MKTPFVTGAAGFIGSNLVDRLLADGHPVVGYDNFSTGHAEFLASASRNANFRLVQGDVLDLPALTAAMKGCDFVFHLAANADVRFGLQHPRKDLEQNTIATSNVLEAMRSNEARAIAFSSTGSIYGEPDVFPTPELAPFPTQTSLYGAAKLAGEGLIAAYCEGYEFEGYLFRFVSILGERYTHGHVFDFCKQLREHPDHLRVLGDGSQRKSYLYVQDCLDAMLHVIERRTAAAAPHRLQVYNLGTDEYCEVKNSIGWICETLQVKPTLEFTGGKRGWVGDSPFIFLDTGKIRATGWKPKLTIRDGVVRTLHYLLATPQILEARR
jgi:UDP-glucose 4-epimerase